MEAHTVKGNKPMSEKDMFEKFDIDRDKREAEKLKHNSRPTSMRRADGEVSQILNYQSTLFLKRKYPEYYDTIIDVMEKRLKTMPPKFKKKHYDSISGTLGQVLLADAHIDQLDTKGTTFSSRKNRIIRGTKELLTKIDLFEPEQLLYVNMGDYFNTSLRNRTANGTEQQNIMSENDAIKFGIDLEAEILLLMSEYAPTIAKHIDGNHDEGRLEALRQVMKYYFKDNPNVDIDPSDAAFQFFEWGNTLFGYDHGHKTAIKNIPEIVNSKRAKKHKHVEHYRGHEHHEKVKQLGGVEIHNIPNAGLQSEREKQKGYAHDPSLFGLVHGKKDGKIAELKQRL